MSATLFVEHHTCELLAEGPPQPVGATIRIADMDTGEPLHVRVVAVDAEVSRVEVIGEPVTLLDCGCFFRGRRFHVDEGCAAHV